MIKDNFHLESTDPIIMRINEIQTPSLGQNADIDLG